MWPYSGDASLISCSTVTGSSSVRSIVTGISCTARATHGKAKRGAWERRQAKAQWGRTPPPHALWLHARAHAWAHLPPRPSHPHPLPVSAAHLCLRGHVLALGRCAARAPRVDGDPDPRVYHAAGLHVRHAEHAAIARMRKPGGGGGGQRGREWGGGEEASSMHEYMHV